MELSKLRALAGFVPILESFEFRPGGWLAESSAKDGVTHLPRVAFGSQAQDFVEMAYQEGWVTAFDWPEWAKSDEARRLRTDPDALGFADAEQIAKLLTFCIRRDRFIEGALLEDFKSGLILRTARRAQALVEGFGD